VERNLILGRQTGQSGNVINHSVREVRCRSNKKNSVGVNQTAHGMNVNLELRLRTRNTVQLDLEVVAGLNESSVGCVGNDPINRQ
jgi:hypothetical protein